MRFEIQQSVAHFYVSIVELNSSPLVRGLHAVSLNLLACEQEEE